MVVKGICVWGGLSIQQSSGIGVCQCITHRPEAGGSQSCRKQGSIKFQGEMMQTQFVYHADGPLIPASLLWKLLTSLYFSFFFLKVELS